MMTIHSQAIASICDAAILCVFAWKGAGSSLAMIRDMINAVTGYGLEIEDLLETGNRIWYMKRSLCNLCGATRADDRVPRRIIEPHLEGSNSGYLGALNPLIRANNRLLGMVRSKKLLEYIKLFNARVLLPNTYRTVSVAGRLLPPRLRRGRGEEGGHPSTAGVDLDYMLEEFYRLRGLDERGFPGAGVLEALGLEEVARALHRGGERL